MKLTARIENLERRRSEVSSRPFRVIVCDCLGPANLAKSTCTRRLGPNGALIEIVNLEGDLEGLTHEDLERFIASFPVEPM